MACPTCFRIPLPILCAVLGLGTLSVATGCSGGGGGSGRATPAPGAVVEVEPEVPAEAPERLVRLPDSDGQLKLTAHHRVVAPDRIEGVLLLANAGAQPIRVLDSANLWGAGQWSVVVDGRREAVNPHVEWSEGDYRESEIASGAVLAMPFAVVHEAGKPAQDRPDARAPWMFSPGATWTRQAAASGDREHGGLGAFSADVRLHVVFDGRRVPPRTAVWRMSASGAAPRWAGTVAARSQAAANQPELEAHLVVEGKPRPRLR